VSLICFIWGSSILFLWRFFPFTRSAKLPRLSNLNPSVGQADVQVRELFAGQFHEKMVFPVLVEHIRRDFVLFIDLIDLTPYDLHQYVIIDRFEHLGLSPREKEVCARLLIGRTLRQISGDLSIAESTVHGYCGSLYKKLGINSRTELFVRFGVTGSDEIRLAALRK